MVAGGTAAGWERALAWMMKARTLLFSSAVYGYPFSIISPKESSMANKHIPAVTEPGFQSWSGWDMSLQLPNVCPSFPWAPASRELGGAGSMALLWSERVLG